MDANQLAAAGFYFTNQSDIVRCDFLWSGNRLLGGRRLCLEGTSALESILRVRKGAVGWKHSYSF